MRNSSDFCSNRQFSTVASSISNFSGLKSESDPGKKKLTRFVSNVTIRTSPSGQILRKLNCFGNIWLKIASKVDQKHLQIPFLDLIYQLAPVFFLI